MERTQLGFITSSMYSKIAIYHILNSKQTDILLNQYYTLCAANDCIDNQITVK